MEEVASKYVASTTELADLRRLLELSESQGIICMQLKWRLQIANFN